MEQSRSVVFREEQKFDQPWLWVLLLMAALSMIGTFSYAVYQQFFLQIPWGSTPMSDTALLIPAITAVVFMTAFLLFFASFRLLTEVRTDGVYIRFYPLHRTFHKIWTDSCVRIDDS